MSAATGIELERGMDFRAKELRREVWMRFYSFHLKYRTHPGCVYFALPYMADKLGWDEHERGWAAWINGNTQNPATTLLLMEEAGPGVGVEQMIDWYEANYAMLEWDTDRRHQKPRFAEATRIFDEITHGNPWKAWGDHAQSWEEAWSFAHDLPHIGRLSAWSMLEYVRILVSDIPDADTLMLEDRAGSRSHRNGLCLLAGLDDWMWWRPNPGFSGVYPPDLVSQLTEFGEGLLAEARERNPGHPDVGYLTLESALCTFKSWHLPNRRYANVYADMMHERIRKAENRFGKRFEVLWDARRESLPAPLRLEDNPYDPGLDPIKQNHYLRTGEVVVMDLDWDCFANDFAANVAEGVYGRRR